MKRVLSIILCVSLALLGQAATFEKADSAVINMGLGWNLGNTLEANHQIAQSPSDNDYWGGQGLDSETCWGQTASNPEIFSMLRKAGFGAVRIPITWYNHMDKEGNIQPEWMERVHAIVDEALAAGLYVIINVHHDTGADTPAGHISWVKADMTWYNNYKSLFETLWLKIANEFRDYDEHLLFEGYNEMLDTYNSWCYASFASPGNYNATAAQSAYDAINSYAQSFVSVVRSTGGNNATRNLIVSTYSAACGVGNWNSHLQDPLKQMLLPEDEQAGHLIFEVHSYPSLVNDNRDRSIAEIKNEISETMAYLNKYLVNKGAPVIIGEWGTSNVDAGTGKTDYDVRRPLMFQFVEHFVQTAKANNIGTFYWMGLTDGLFRTIPAFSQADLAECMAKAYHGSTFIGEFPTLGEIEQFTCFEGEKTLDWGNGITIPADLIAAMGGHVEIELTYRNNNGMFQLYAGDWSEKLNFEVDGKTYVADFQPNKHYGTSGSQDCTTVLQFDQATEGIISAKGVIIHGTSLTIQQAVLRKRDADGLENVTNSAIMDDRIYNLLGQPVQEPQQGVYIQGMKKYIKVN